ncbi:hypothetical protein V6N11_077208 [Hibiscus sabdariffa]|uniref:Uncharacterized protein n=1 Tax=Hibiscus sabdariffa TaxID=183260 RepID=A0ABR2TCE9_9ROSI
MGGRPPDPDMNVGQLQVFERLASPVGKVGKEEQRLAKKSRNEDNDTCIWLRKKNSVEGLVEDDECLDPDRIVVLDEDCLVDTVGSFTSIKFSDCVHDQIDRCVKGICGPWMIASGKHRRNNSAPK